MSSIKSEHNNREVGQGLVQNDAVLMEINRRDTNKTDSMGRRISEGVITANQKRRSTLAKTRTVDDAMSADGTSEMTPFVEVGRTRTLKAIEEQILTRDQTENTTQIVRLLDSKNVKTPNLIEKAKQREKKKEMKMMARLMKKESTKHAQELMGLNFKQMRTMETDESKEQTFTRHHTKKLSTMSVDKASSEKGHSMDNHLAKNEKMMKQLMSVMQTM